MLQLCHIKLLKTMKINIGISDSNRQEVKNVLERVLADEFILYTKTRNAHWNVEGNDFYEKHTLFETQYEQLDSTIDSVAERIRIVGFKAPASLQQFLALTQLSEENKSEYDSQSLITELLLDHEAIILFLRENINLLANEYGDLGTSDFITGLLQEHEKTAWILRSHLK
jgi:starvation-inducible DNA-binding protein